MKYLTSHIRISIYMCHEIIFLYVSIDGALIMETFLLFSFYNK